MTQTYSFGRKVAAWAVHAFTMTGIAWACLAVAALLHGDIRAMWGWLAISMVVDGLDGSMARKAEVSKVIPWFDGALLDNIVDYLTWTFIPALFLYLHIDFWGSKPLAMVMMIAICVTSMFCYSNLQHKSTDNYFVGFPAAWNIVILYLYLLQTSSWFNTFIVVLFIVLTVTPMTFVHPFRVKKLMIPNIISVVIWIVCAIYLVVVYPQANLVVNILWWVSGIWFIGIGIVRTFVGHIKLPRPKRSEQQS